ncbi:uncharacterized protein LOC132754912 [Ruditapes philippinarum]|uniref:uncharacterized protein LOC132754912 n=1 Tax=Ruditapes philippinarum TaxID=129788 RepID=UPI00295B6F0A|nr:uncharacterized protein LOC132754912 [Ruditapes philippinarum]
MLERDLGWNARCPLGFQIYNCRFHDSMPKSTSTNVSKICGPNYSTYSTLTDLKHVQTSNDFLTRLTRYNLPSLSNKWKSQISRASMSSPRKSTKPSGRIEQIRALRPITKDHHHQDSLFGNSFQSKSFFIVHPEWISETVDNTDPEPLHRPPWPWEQPRYRQNIQIPITYKVDETEEEKNKTENQEKAEDNSDMPMVMDAPMCLPIGYTFTHPGIDLTKPYEKQTQFGAPLVDTSVYKLSY